MDNEPTDFKATAEPAEAEEKKQAAAELKKFKDVDALQKAYLSLQAEFTRRSQRLKELESEVEALRAPEEENAPDKTEAEVGQTPKAVISDEEKSSIIEEYLKSVAQNRGAPVIFSGSGVAAPKPAPRSVREAGALAERFLKL